MGTTKAQRHRRKNWRFFMAQEPGPADEPRRRFGHNNPNKDILLEPAKPESPCQAGYDGSPDNTRLEHGLVKQRQAGNLGRQMLRELHVYGQGGRSMYRYVETTRHGLTGLQLDDVICPQEVIHQYIEEDGTPRFLYAAGNVRLYKPCGMCGCQVERKEMPRGRKTSWQVCINPQFIEAVRPTYKPFRVFKSGFTKRTTTFVTGEDGLMKPVTIEEEVGNIRNAVMERYEEHVVHRFETMHDMERKTDRETGMLEPFHKFMERVPDGERFFCEEPVKVDATDMPSWEGVDPEEWIAKEEARIEQEETLRSAHDIHLGEQLLDAAHKQVAGLIGEQEHMRTDAATHARESAEEQYQGTDEGEVNEGSLGDYEGPTLEMLHATIEREIIHAQQPKNKSIRMGPVDAQFLDHFTEGHPMAWMVSLVLSHVGMPYEDFTDPLYWYELRRNGSENKKLTDEQEHKRYWAHEFSKAKKTWAKGLSWYQFMLVQRTKDKPEHMSDKEWREHIRARYCCGEAEAFTTVHDRYLDLSKVKSRQLMEKDDGTFYEKCKFKQGDKIPFKNRAFYLKWRLDTTTCWVEDREKPKASGGYQLKEVMLREAWPVLYVELKRLTYQANLELFRDMNLDDKVIECLNRIDNEHASWYYTRFGDEWQVVLSQPVMKMLDKVKKRLLELKAEGVDLNEKYAMGDVRGQIYPMDRFAIAGQMMGRMLISGRGYDTSEASSIVRSDDNDMGSPQFAFTNLVRHTWKARWSEFKRQHKKGLTLPDGTDLMHATPKKMAASPHLKLFGPAVCAAIIRAIMWRRMGFWLNGQERPGIYSHFDLFNLDLRHSEPQFAWFLHEPGKQPKRITDDEAYEYQFDDDVEVTCSRLKMVGWQRKFFKPDYRDKSRRWRSSSLDIMFAPDPEKVAVWLKDIVEAKTLALQKRDSREITNLTIDLHNDEGNMDLRSYKALWALLRQQVANVKSSLRKHSTRK